MRIVTSEQHESARAILAQAGVLHGDTVEAELAVGTRETPNGSHLAFCSAVVKPGRRLRQGSPEEQLQPISGAVAFDNPSLIDGVVKGRQGIAVLRCTIHSNGHVHITPKSVRFVERLGEEEGYYLRSSHGQELCAEALASG